jgi:ABC-type glutathione transport system ATPase component
VAENCLGGDLLEGRTVLLVTHNVVLAEQISDFVVVLGLDGRVTSQGSMSDVLKDNSRLRKRAEKQNKEAAKVKKQKKETEGNTDDNNHGKLIIKEEMGVGHIGWKAGSSPHLFCSSLLIVLRSKTLSHQRWWVCLLDDYTSLPSRVFHYASHRELVLGLLVLTV